MNQIEINYQKQFEEILSNVYRVGIEVEDIEFTIFMELIKEQLAILFRKGEFNLEVKL